MEVQKYIAGALFTTIVVLLVSSYSKSNEETTVVRKVIKDTTEVVKITIDSTKLNKELLIEYLLHIDIEHPEVAYAIARLESNMCSDIFKSNKNLFGMKHPGVRPTLSKGPNRGFASFDKWQQSVLDYKLYLEFVGGHKMTREQYLDHLDRNYAHTGYSSHIRKFFDEFHEYKQSKI